MGDKLSSLEWLPDTVDRAPLTSAPLTARLAFPRRFKQGLQLLLNAVFPHSCPVCDELVQSDGGVCLSCWQTLELISAPYCERLGIPLHYELGPNAWSAAALVNPPDYDRARASVLYNGPAKELVKRFKFYGEIRLSKLLAVCMLNAATELLQSDSILIPVPLHTARLRERTYNQSALLAREVGTRLDCQFILNGLFRTRRTNQQVGLKRDARTANVRGAFAVSDDFLPNVSGANVVLVDDVLTTGATVEECARVLKAAGAARVDVLVFALVDPDKVSEYSD
ncbi:Ribose-phosphate pyrophosphokinase [Pseudovibrio axinellae]|uniref:Ribose-phosphate pyrophosphokinase n=1 Tax=Pseudovibrio axinellae TaxID=989403 RepID=A0A165WIB8_9HYPH|nr:ComF family protein [Pseudovibrio axinellae]KZL16556.1 Ribose-phosphate pyrophosphokinase [Pseudovibrio axinellae]SEQ15947.1 comF family protein [Pseudovibrio axinellae]